MEAMHLSHIRGLIFDLDGTLIDSETDLINATNATLRKLGRPELPAGTISGFIGHGAARLVSRALGSSADERQHAEALQVFLRYYEANKLENTVAYPGVTETLEKLWPMPMAVLTNKPALPSRLILESLDLAKFFSAVYGGDSFASRKPDPMGAQQILRQFAVLAPDAMLIGDSEVDVQTARNAGVLAANVNYGFGIHDRSKYPADLYLDRLTELVPLLRSASS